MHLIDHMKRQKFNKLYRSEFLKPLEAIGFEIFKKKSLRYSEQGQDLRLVVLGGKFAKPGVIRTVICFRHQFLRPPKNGYIGEDVFDVAEFPRKLTFYDFSGTYVRPDYQSDRFYQWGFDSLDYVNADEDDVSKRLDALKETMVNRVLPWMKVLTPYGELAQMKKHGRNTWFERLWIEDYEGFIKNERSVCGQLKKRGGYGMLVCAARALTKI